MYIKIIIETDNSFVDTIRGGDIITQTCVNVELGDGVI